MLSNTHKYIDTVYIYIHRLLGYLNKPKYTEELSGQKPTVLLKVNNLVNVSSPQEVMYLDGQPGSVSLAACSGGEEHRDERSGCASRRQHPRGRSHGELGAAARQECCFEWHRPPATDAEFVTSTTNYRTCEKGSTHTRKLLKYKYEFAWMEMKLNLGFEIITTFIFNRFVKY